MLCVRGLDCKTMEDFYKKGKVKQMEKELFIKQLRPYLYLMDEAHEATGYIVVGDEKVCVIDTMNGYNDLYKVVRGITDKPHRI